ncbi:hypothetical protein J4E93_007054 [Alternaria ventricosa]|uniref:uncharacterized protein n=1 Tax=Alternaria ventricosa TaxID=1187951 RepID=UPI0020C40B1C|nr:uncharacterized protein J4E93_007054 [Alternaria ventricosa]KAI4642985.1 hypothetical protein J4E93_007054 [Alternaria ventricosa]
MSGYLWDEANSIAGEALTMRTFPLTQIITKEPLYGNGSIHFKHIRHKIQDVLIVSSSDGSAEAVYRNETPVAQECHLSWCVKTMSSSYTWGGYNEEVVDTVFNTTSGPFPWEAYPYQTEVENGTDIFYMENITIKAGEFTGDGKLANFGTSNNTALALMQGFTDIFPAYTTQANKSASPILRYKTWKTGSPWHQTLFFNPWLAPNNVTRHMERLATALTNVIRSAPTREDVEGHAFSKANFVSTTNAPSCVECGLKCPNCSSPRAPAVKLDEKKNARLPEPDQVSPGNVDLPRPDNPNARSVANQTEKEGDKDDSNLHIEEEDKKGEDEDEDEDDAKVEWSKYVSLRLYKMARADPSLMTMTAAEIEQFNEQGLKHQYDKHFSPRERTLWDDESLPRHLVLKLIRFRQSIERDAANALETEDKEPNYDAHIFDQPSDYLSDLRNYAYELVAEDREREVKATENMQEAAEHGSAEEEYESAEEEYEHPGEDDYRPSYSDRSRNLPAMEHSYPTSTHHSEFSPVNYNSRNTYGHNNFFGQNAAPQDDWSGNGPQSSRGETTYYDWDGSRSPEEETTWW